MDIDTSETSRGIVKVKFDTGTEKKVKLLIKHDDGQYYYNLSNGDEYVSFPLQLGNGDYTIAIYENTTGTKYRKLTSEEFTVALEDQKQVFLNSIQEIQWDDEYNAIQLADKMVEDAIEEKGIDQNLQASDLSDEEIINIMYDFVVENVAYDYKKIENLKYNYLPNIDSTVETGTGICYDYSSLLASMLRSQGIPTKLVKGYTSWTSVYHAWNEVYLASEDRWVVVDTT